MTKKLLLTFMLTALIFPLNADTGDFGDALKYSYNNNYTDAYVILKRIAEKGDTRAQLFLGHAYYSGHGVIGDKTDYKEAIKWYTLAAKQGNVDAQYWSGRIYYKGGYGIEKDYKKSLRWYTLAAEQGDKGAQYSLGVMYANGKGTKKDYKKAIKWYTLATEQDLAIAINNLAGMYYHGRGVKQDYKEAFRLAYLGSEKGGLMSDINLANMYYHSHGVEKDLIRSYVVTSIFIRGAKMADRYWGGPMLGENYTGESISDEDDIYTWDLEEAIKEREAFKAKLLKEMTQKQIEEAEKEIEQIGY